MKIVIFAISCFFDGRTDTGHHYDQKSSYVEIGQLIGNAPGGAKMDLHDFFAPTAPCVFKFQFGYYICIFCVSNFTKIFKGLKRVRPKFT